MSACQIPPVKGMECQYTDSSLVNWNDGLTLRVVSGSTVDLKYNAGTQTALNVPMKQCLDGNSSDAHTWGCIDWSCPTGHARGGG